MTRASSAIFSKGYEFLVILSSLDLISSRKGQLETCVQSSVAQRQFHIEWDYMLRFCKALPWALRIKCAWVIRSRLFRHSYIRSCWNRVELLLSGTSSGLIWSSDHVSSVAERQFQIEWDLHASSLQGIALGLENQCAWVIRIHVCQTFLYSELLEPY